MATIKTLPWDPAKYLDTEEDIVAYLEAAREDGDPALMAEVFDVIERAWVTKEVTSKWAGPDGALGSYIRQESSKSLEAYKNQPNNLKEDANMEEDTARGGYADRQVFELVQNSADALTKSDGEHIWLRLTPTHLYCADNGTPIDEDGVRALLFSHLSGKRGTAEIGRFGLGFKSVLGVTDTPEFFSRSGSFRFDRDRSAHLLAPIAPDIGRYPVLRIAEPLDPWQEIQDDPDLREMAYWAKNIVRLPLKPGAHQNLDGQIRKFPAEFLLFVDHVGSLVLEADYKEAVRIIGLTQSDEQWKLDDAGNITQWMIEKRVHQLSAEAKNDRRTLDDLDEVPIWWAAPIEKLNEPGKFWAFSPTITQSLVSGILNAPWKTNEDRQNLLQGPYNDELINVAARIVADALPKLSTPEDPARHLDALPRRYEAGDTQHSDSLRNRLFSHLGNRAVAPDQTGKLCQVKDLTCSPVEWTSDSQPALERWAACQGRPEDWLHHRALTRNRLAKVERLFASNISEGPDPGPARRPLHYPKATMSQWLEALVQGAKSRQHTKLNANEKPNAIHDVLPTGENIVTIEAELEQTLVEASQGAIQTAALVPAAFRVKSKDLGRIVLASNGQWVTPDPEVTRLRGANIPGTGMFIHDRLESDHETLEALRELGLRPATPTTAFTDLARTLFSNLGLSPADVRWAEFWQLSKDLNQVSTAEIIRTYYNWRDVLLVKTIAGAWKPLSGSLLPGRIVPDDGSRDGEIAIDVEFHAENLELLRCLGVSDGPQANQPLSGPHYRRFVRRCRQEFTRRDLPRQPKSDLLNFDSSVTTGPLSILTNLSDEGNTLYTWALLSIGNTYVPWTMRHDSQSLYGTAEFRSPALEIILEFGLVRTDGGFLRLSDGVGDPPRSLAVLERLLSHPSVHLIQDALHLAGEVDAPLELIGEEAPIPLTDVWPALKPYIPFRYANLELVRCDALLEYGGAEGNVGRDCLVKNDLIYMARKREEEDELLHIVGELGLSLTREQIGLVIGGLADTQVKTAREAVRVCSTDAQRLLQAVGETRLRLKLPPSLVTILEQDQSEPLTGEDIAEAAISMFHTAALKEYRYGLSHLAPPRMWAGTGSAVEFVQSLGFGQEWAGEPNTPRFPYVDVEGPSSLPQLHAFQRLIVNKVKSFLNAAGTGGERRGMISMPTGSGKTRVTVQAIVEAIRDDEFEGGVLWVADRDELCEQAVEGWRQVWSSVGPHGTNLRISRLWGGQPVPLPTDNRHVIVATIQTLASRIATHPESYGFLRDLNLLVFDEAHRSVAPTFTSVMEELGLTRFRRPTEPIIIGLTATPYRGYNEPETRRLVDRYSGNRLDDGAFASNDPEGVVAHLQRMGVLALANHATIEGGHFVLSHDELRQSRETPWLPQSVEYRIAHDSLRTQRITDAFEHHIQPDWATLVFATSVEHAQTVSALLNSRNVKSRAISSSTETSVRHRVVEQFRQGEIMALVNYGVFREGFDAPNTRAILVARPVYSPNLYFQMIGRGLRGVKNGGSDRCLVLNVSDNIENFERKLAFTEMDWLWDR